MRIRRATGRIAATVLGLVVTLAWGLEAAPPPLKLWHSFRDRERLALETVVAAYNLEHDPPLRAVYYSADGFTDRLEQAIRAGNGPDLFIWAHDKTGEWSERSLVLPLDDRVDSTAIAEFFPNCLEAVRWKSRLWGLPLSFETLILYYNRNLVPSPPVNTDEMITMARRISDPDERRYGLVYERANFYHHSAWFHGFGGQVFDEAGRFDATSPAMIHSLEFARDLAAVHHIVPDTVDWKTQMELFNSGRAGMLISGQWALGAIDRTRIPLGLALLPYLTEGARWAAPFLGVKGVFLSARTRQPADAVRAALYLTSGPSEAVMNILAAHLPANRQAYRNSVVAADTVTSMFKEQVLYAIPMPSHPAMKHVWKVLMTEAGTFRHGALDSVFLDRRRPEEAARAAQSAYQRLAGASR